MLESHYPITSLADALTRLVVATVLGAALGLNRELRHKPAGLRTHALVSLGSALTTVVMVELVTASGTNGIDSISRVIQGIVAGVGFIGGGVILRRLHEGEVQGLTTAASVWVVAAIGLACGAGEMIVAAAAVVLSIGTLALGAPFEGYVKRRFGAPMRDRHDPDPRDGT